MDMISYGGSYIRFTNVMVDCYNHISSLPSPKPISQLTPGTTSRIDNIPDEILEGGNPTVSHDEILTLQAQINQLEAEKIATQQKLRAEAEETRKREVDRLAFEQRAIAAEQARSAAERAEQEASRRLEQERLAHEKERKENEAQLERERTEQARLRASQAEEATRARQEADAQISAKAADNELKIIFKIVDALSSDEFTPSSRQASVLPQPSLDDYDTGGLHITPPQPRPSVDFIKSKLAAKGLDDMEPGEVVDLIFPHHHHLLRNSSLQPRSSSSPTPTPAPSQEGFSAPRPHSSPASGGVTSASRSPGDNRSQIAVPDQPPATTDGDVVSTSPTEQFIDWPRLNHDAVVGPPDHCEDQQAGSGDVHDSSHDSVLLKDVHASSSPTTTNTVQIDPQNVVIPSPQSITRQPVNPQGLSKSPVTASSHLVTSDQIGSLSGDGVNTWWRPLPTSSMQDHSSRLESPLPTNSERSSSSIYTNPALLGSPNNSICNRHHTLAFTLAS